ncbi:MAG: hypothetical protein H3Z50_00205 [archaeon]|nr:hypothetical protein [archaeon]MCP8305884.1 hypothetical protein [archaeon]
MEKEKLKALKDDPVLFSRLILKFYPFDYQDRILEDESDRLIAICGRQVGKSTCSAIKLLRFAVTNPKTTSIVVSATLRQSMETFNKVLGFINSSILRNSVKRMTRTQIIFKNNSRIVCLPSGRYGSTLRGLTVHFAVIDEASFIYDEVIANAIFPMLTTTKGKIWMLTTPWDRDHITYRCFNSKDWSVYHFPSSKNPLIKEEFLDEQRQLIGEERYRLEYLAEFVDDSRSYFPMTLLRPCIDECLEESRLGGEYFAGYDPGGKESLAALVVIERLKDHLYTLYFRGVKDIPYTQFTVEIADLHKKFRFKSLAIDMTGLGNPIVEHARELDLPVDGFNLTQKFREELLSNLRILFEQRKVSLPQDTQFLGSLNCIEYERTRTGGYHFSHRQECLRIL